MINEKATSFITDPIPVSRENMVQQVTVLLADKDMRESPAYNKYINSFTIDQLPGALGIIQDQAFRERVLSSQKTFLNVANNDSFLLEDGPLSVSRYAARFDSFVENYQKNLVKPFNQHHQQICSINALADLTILEKNLQTELQQKQKNGSLEEVTKLKEHQAFLSVLEQIFETETVGYRINALSNGILQHNDITQPTSDAISEKAQNGFLKIISQQLEIFSDELNAVLESVSKLELSNSEQKTKMIDAIKLLSSQVRDAQTDGYDLNTFYQQVQNFSEAVYQFVVSGKTS